MVLFAGFGAWFWGWVGRVFGGVVWDVVLGLGAFWGWAWGGVRFLGWGVVWVVGLVVVWVVGLVVVLACYCFPAQIDEFNSKNGPFSNFLASVYWYFLYFLAFTSKKASKSNDLEALLLVFFMIAGIQQ